MTTAGASNEMDLAAYGLQTPFGLARDKAMPRLELACGIPGIVRESEWAAPREVVSQPIMSPPRAAQHFGRREPGTPVVQRWSRRRAPEPRKHTEESRFARLSFRCFSFCPIGCPLNEA